MSDAAGAPDSDPVAELRERRRVWAEKPVLRMCYEGWLARIRPWAREGRTLEVAAGAGMMKEIWGPGLVATDILETPWIDRPMDALAMDVAEGEFDNVLGIDAIHHFNDPHAFLDQAARATRDGGRLLLVEPWISPASWLGYRALHHEDVWLGGYKRPGTETSDPWAGNLAMANVVFGRERADWPRRHPEWRIVRLERFSFFDFQLAGGYKRWALVGNPKLYAAFLKADALLAPLMPLLAFRVFAVLERAPRAG